MQFHLPSDTSETEEHPIITTEPPDVKIAKDIKNELLNQVEETGIVIVHCSVKPTDEMYIRIWSSTFLIDKTSGERSHLHHADNITIAPIWTLIEAQKNFRFALIFSPLPKSCECFDLLEDIPEAGGFFIQNIKRNKSDVYHVNI